MALEDRFRLQARESGISVDRLRRRVMFERIIARLEYSEPGLWVLKGGMALEVRLQDDARLTKDIDLGFRDHVANGEALHERLVEVLRTDPHGDRFVFASQSTCSTWRGRWWASHVAADGERKFGRPAVR